MSLTEIFFYVFAALTLAGALGIVFTKNILYAAFSLLLTFLGVAALYVLAGADLLAVVQIMIYVGGVLVLMIFGVMLTSKATDKYLPSPIHNRIAGTLAGLALFGLFITAILKANFSALPWITQSAQNSQTVNESTVAGIGIGLMTDFVLPFEIAGILLMVALLGAAYIAGRK
jgi:NADH:ubiquinone oxidoreductase subunit 6 (subunit J)